MSRVTLLLLAYNQASLVRESALACLAQNCEPLDIVFSDDASTDNTYDILVDVASAYRGPHKVTVQRNPKNLGIGEHFNALIAASSGQLLIASAGDDVSVPDRASRIIQAWDESGQKADLISSHCIRMQYDGVLRQQIYTDALDRITAVQWAQKRPYIIGATHAFTRRLHERFGPFNPDVGREDQIMVFRAICAGGAITINKALVQYRDGGFARTSNEMTSAAHLASLRKNAKLDLAELKQLMRDANLTEQSTVLQQIFQPQLHRASFLDDLMPRTELQSMLAVVMRHRAVPFWWRIKKVFAIFFHDFYTDFQRYNQARRQFIRRVRGRQSNS
jgi:glycosyltransferase involved in cell wall biosynthesis